MTIETQYARTARRAQFCIVTETATLAEIEAWVESVNVELPPPEGGWVVDNGDGTFAIPYDPELGIGTVTFARGDYLVVFTEQTLLIQDGMSAAQFDAQYYEVDPPA